MSDAFAIEVADETVGIVVRQEGDRGYRFHAALRSVHALDGHVFANALAAERAARLHLEPARRRAS